MAKRKKQEGKSLWLILLGFVLLTLVVAAILRGKDVILFNPKGLIAHEQNRLLVTSTLIMIAFAAAVLFFLYYFAWKYRETNEKAHYNPHAGRSKSLVVAAWALPTGIMIVLASMMIPATFRLEPQDTIEAKEPPLKIQVVAMRWKWLFIYPEQDIATVNYVEIPVNTPVQFELTADETPMSSFWIPHLAGQLYAMTEHVNRLNVMADTLGDYEGSAAEINGPGFAGMRFTTRVSNQYNFDRWVDDTKQSGQALNATAYKKLLKPSENHAVTLFRDTDPSLYPAILSKYEGSHGGAHGGAHDVEIEKYEAKH